MPKLVQTPWYVPYGEGSKDNSVCSHDVVLLCFNCHEAAQKSAEQVKKEIAR